VQRLLGSFPTIKGSLKEQGFRELLVRPPPLANKVHHAQRYFTTSPALSDQDGMVASGAMPLV
jgi:hypothetical protein